MDKISKWDYSVYPDVDAPDLDDPSVSEIDKADYLDRLCHQADFGFFPTGDQILALRDWKEIFDKYPCLDSSTYHVFRCFFGWEELEQAPYMLNRKLPWQLQDEREGREADMLLV